MKTTLRYLGLNATATSPQLVQEHLNRLQSLTAVEAAQIILERLREAKPAFRAHVVLVVAGPDYHAEAVDHTLAAALHKAVANLQRQIQARHNQRRVKVKSNLQLGPLSRRWSSALAGHQA